MNLYDGNEAKLLVENILDTYILAFCLMRDEIERRYRDIMDTL